MKDFVKKDFREDVVCLLFIGFFVGWLFCYLLEFYYLEIQKRIVNFFYKFVICILWRLNFILENLVQFSYLFMQGVFNQNGFFDKVLFAVVRVFKYFFF